MQPRQAPCWVLFLVKSNARVDINQKSFSSTLNTKRKDEATQKAFYVARERPSPYLRLRQPRRFKTEGGDNDRQLPEKKNEQEETSPQYWCGPEDQWNSRAKTINTLQPRRYGSHLFARVTSSCTIAQSQQWFQGHIKQVQYHITSEPTMYIQRHIDCSIKAW